MYSTPVLRKLARFVARRAEGLDRRLYTWQVGRFIRDQEVRGELVPAFCERFRAARPAFWRLNDDLLGTVLSRRRMLPRLRAFQRPTRIVFGADDPCLNVRVARSFHRQFPGSELFLLPNARHYVQVDEPQEVARLILTLPIANPTPLRPRHRHVDCSAYANGLSYDTFSLDETQVRVYGDAAVVIGRVDQSGHLQDQPLPIEAVRATLVLVNTRKQAAAAAAGRPAILLMRRQPQPY